MLSANSKAFPCAVQISSKTEKYQLFLLLHKNRGSSTVIIIIYNIIIIIIWGKAEDKTVNISP